MESMACLCVSYGVNVSCCESGNPFTCEIRKGVKVNVDYRPQGCTWLGDIRYIHSLFLSHETEHAENCKTADKAGARVEKAENDAILQKNRVIVSPQGADTQSLMWFPREWVKNEYN